MVPAPEPNSQLNVYFVSVFSLHGLGSPPDTCGSIHPTGLQLTEAFLWYLRKHNTKNTLVSFGGFVLDSCTYQQLITQKVFSFETGQIACTLENSNIIKPENALVYIGADNLPNTVALSQALERTRETQISPLLDIGVSQKKRSPT